MRRIFFLLISIFCALLMDAQNKQNIKVLYVSGSSDWQDNYSETAVLDRADAFEKYLNNYFTEVRVVKNSDYYEDLSKNFDVTIFDGKLKGDTPNLCTRDEKGNIVDFYKPKSLSEEFNYPALFIADNGDNIGRGIGIKTDWYCLCLDANAHSTNLNHQIFKGPFDVDIKLTQEQTPEGVFHYKYFYEGEIPQTLPMWKVQNKGYMTDKGFRVGMVARPWGFVDSPDCESISSGTSAKTIDAVAIGRHGNFFFWGFSASPTYMTESAKQVFANSIVYIASLKGERVIARKYYDRAATREYVKELVYNTTKEAYLEREESNKKFFMEQSSIQDKIKQKKINGESLTNQEEMLLSRNIKYEQLSYDDFLRKQMKNGYYEMFNGDAKAFAKYIKDNKPYLYGAAMFYKYIVDEDAKSLKIANNDIKILDKAISLLEKNKDIDKAQRILDRYTLCTFTKAEDWREWFNSNKDKLFFTESGGWLFMVDTKDNLVEGNNYKAKANYLAANTIELDEVDDKSPVSVGAKLVTYHGGSQAVLVKFKIAKGYHIYANVSDNDPFIKTNVELLESDNYKYKQIQLPPSGYYNENGTTIYENEAVFVIPISGYGLETLKVKCEWQCCDSQICFPPMEKVLNVETTLEKYK